MKRIIILLLLTLLSSNTFSQQSVIYNGDTALLKIIKDIFPDAQPVSKPGGNGVIAFHELDTSPKSVHYSLNSTSLIPVFDDKATDPSKKFKLISVLTSESLTLVTASISPYNNLDELTKNKKRIVVSGLNVNSGCFLVSKLIEKYYGVETLFLAYKNTSQADIDIFRGDVDVSCRAGLKLSQSYSTGLIKPIANLSRSTMNFNFKVPHAKFQTPQFTYYLFGSNDLTDSEIDAIKIKIQNYANRKETSQIFTESHSVFLGITDSEDVHRFYNNQVAEWLQIKKGIK